ncbi:hypothetical protein QWY85_20840 [Neolewinella lacunae]|uniref:Uncharacterized protein n=1 Tax=Neolewinella lacunae TaxID=1517758 RepID=A0A923PKA6_9BACT|nr:hypothetical protein [Neolewinella lacunae]MBC6994251.1 hypothetical protein [Neolewinella lacunae]MDN3637131.1 hypothetical protein [Neolewinella lacunae]
MFQAWYGIDMPEKYPQRTLEERLALAAKHDLLWEEPLSQLGEKVDLVIGLEWAGEYAGLARTFDPASLEKAKKNRAKLLALNPNMKILFEIRWRDAPSSFLPEDSPFWLREDGEIKKGWLGGWVPFYLLDYMHPDFIKNVGEQARVALESGIYDGVMLDWSGDLEVVKSVREHIGEDGIIIVNIHDDIEDGEKYKDYINGSFMELNPVDDTSISKSNGRNWERTRQALLWFEEHLRKPTYNCLEVWGDRDDLSRMRATTTLGLTHSDGYVLFGDPNPLKTPDHLHDWYDFWDADLGLPTGPRVDREDGAFSREFSHGTVVYNPYENEPVSVQFPEPRRSVATGSTAKTFTVAPRDGDIFLQ